jgi:uncharacterized protein YecT (DUF1311 family)
MAVHFNVRYLGRCPSTEKTARKHHDHYLPTMLYHSIKILCVRTIVLAFSLTASAVYARNLDCNKTQDAVEKGICADSRLRDLNQQMSTEYAAALTSSIVAKDVLKADQLQWIVERDILARFWQFPRDGSGDSGTASSFLALAYAARIGLLHSLVERRTPLEPAKTIAEALRPWYGRIIGDDLMGVLSSHNSSIRLPARKYLSELDKNTPLSTPPDRLLDKLHDEFQLNPGAIIMTVDVFSDSGYGAVWGVGPTPDCQDVIVFIRNSAGIEQPIPTPDILYDNCGHVTGSIATISGKPVAIREEFHPTEIELAFQAWQDGAWSMAGALRLRFAEKDAPVVAACGQKRCAAVQLLADKLITRFRHHPVPGVLDIALTPAEKQQFARMVQLNESGKLPKFAAHRPRLTGFARDAVDFPAKLNGQLVMGRIGHSHFIWSDYDEWVVGFWSLKKDELQPVGRALTEVSQAQLLFAAPVEPRLP